MLSHSNSCDSDIFQVNLNYIALISLLRISTDLPAQRDVTKAIPVGSYMKIAMSMCPFNIFSHKQHALQPTKHKHWSSATSLQSQGTDIVDCVVFKRTGTSIRDAKELL